MLDYFAEVVFVERGDYRALGADSLAQAEPQPARDNLCGPRDHQVIEFGPGLAADLYYILEPLRGDERGARALAFEQCVCGDRRAVDDFRRCKLGVREYARHASEYRVS